MTPEQEATNAETRKHIQEVATVLSEFRMLLAERARQHDQSKLVSPEVEVFTEYTSRLRATTYGSEEYRECLKGMGTALGHHYANNRHHPEHHEAGIEGMNLVDIVEMFSDWLAATKRHDDGDIRRSIELNQKRFNMSPQLRRIFENTADLFDED